VKKTETPRGANGQADPEHRPNGKGVNGSGAAKPPNGHATISLERDAISARGEPAASDDACGAFAPGSANSSATRANRDSSAEAARVPRSGKDEEPPRPPNTGKKTRKKGQVAFPGPTDWAAMQDSAAFANAAGEIVDLVAVSASLLQSGDEKIRKAELDKIREMKFGKIGASPAAQENPVLIWDLPGADPMSTEK
jgi:hypothetical protein